MSRRRNASEGERQELLGTGWLPYVDADGHESASLWCRVGLANIYGVDTALANARAEAARERRLLETILIAAVEMQGGGDCTKERAIGTAADYLGSIFGRARAG